MKTSLISEGGHLSDRQPDGGLRGSPDHRPNSYCLLTLEVLHRKGRLYLSVTILGCSNLGTGLRMTRWPCRDDINQTGDSQRSRGNLIVITLKNGLLNIQCPFDPQIWTCWWTDVSTGPLPESRGGLSDTVFTCQIHFHEHFQGRILESNPFQRQT